MNYTARNQWVNGKCERCRMVPAVTLNWSPQPEHWYSCRVLPPLALTSKAEARRPGQFRQRGPSGQRTLTIRSRQAFSLPYRVRKSRKVRVAAMPPSLRPAEHFVKPIFSKFERERGPAPGVKPLNHRISGVYLTLLFQF